MVKMISMDEALEQLGMSKRTMWRYIGSKDINAYKIGRDWKFKQADIDDFVERRSSLRLVGKKPPAKAHAQARKVA